jgi:hypothetical protein
MNSTLLGGVGKLGINYVLNNLPKLIIKENRDLGFKSVYGRKLNKEQDSYYYFK